LKYDLILSKLLLTRYEKGGVTINLDGAVYFAESTLDYTDSNDEASEAFVRWAVDLLQRKYDIESKDNDFEKARHFMESLISGTQNIQKKATLFHNLAILTRAQADKKATTCLQDFDDIIKMFTYGIETMNSSENPRLTFISSAQRSIGTTYYRRYLLSKDTGDADLCLKNLALARNNPDEPSQQWGLMTEMAAHWAFKFWRDTSLSNYGQLAACFFRELIGENYKAVESKGLLASILRELAEDLPTKSTLDEH
jgi:hypothetical protein